MSRGEDVAPRHGPGLGYADDYTPWFVDVPVGAMTRARAIGVAEDGVLAVTV